jgi:hypothetical protein
MTSALHHVHAAVRSDVPGDALPSGIPSPSGRGAGRCAALGFLCRLENACGQGTGVVSAVTFQGALIDLCTTDGDRETFPGVKDLGLYVEATIAAHAGRRPAQTAVVPPQARLCWEKWCDVLADLAARPATVEVREQPGRVFAVHRLPTVALIAVTDGMRAEVRSIALGEGPQHRLPHRPRRRDPETRLMY